MKVNCKYDCTRTSQPCDAYPCLVSISRKCKALVTLFQLTIIHKRTAYSMKQLLSSTEVFSQCRFCLLSNWLLYDPARSTYYLQYRRDCPVWKSDSRFPLSDTVASETRFILLHRLSFPRARGDVCAKNIHRHVPRKLHRVTSLDNRELSRTDRIGAGWMNGVDSRIVAEIKRARLRSILMLLIVSGLVLDVSWRRVHTAALFY